MGWLKMIPNFKCRISQQIYFSVGCALCWTRVPIRGINQEVANYWKTFNWILVTLTTMPHNSPHAIDFFALLLSPQSVEPYHRSGHHDLGHSIYGFHRRALNYNFTTQRVFFSLSELIKKKPNSGTWCDQHTTCGMFGFAAACERTSTNHRTWLVSALNWLPFMWGENLENGVSASNTNVCYILLSLLWVVSRRGAACMRWYRPT